jgi:dCTP deaminase
VILSDREIKAALERGSIRITPDPRAEALLWSSTALDLRLGDQLGLWNLSATDAPQTFSPVDSAHLLKDLIARFVHATLMPP